VRLGSWTQQTLATYSWVSVNRSVQPVWRLISRQKETGNPSLRVRLLIMSGTTSMALRSPQPEVIARPNSMARIFDTSIPGTVENGNPDLGSPNSACPAGGPGVGNNRTIPGKLGENCTPLGSNIKFHWLGLFYSQPQSWILPCCLHVVSCRCLDYAREG
jgi:hypothetical protein